MTALSILNFSEGELTYCLIAMSIDDWHHEPFCERILIREYEEVMKNAKLIQKESEDLTEMRDYEISKKAKAVLSLSRKDVENLQTEISAFSIEDRENLCTALQYLIAL